MARVLTVSTNTKRHASGHFQSLSAREIVYPLCPFVYLSEHEPYKEPINMSESKDKTVALNVRLKPSESSAHPRATNYTNVGVA